MIFDNITYVIGMDGSASFILWWDIHEAWEVYDIRIKTLLWSNRK